MTTKENLQHHFPNYRISVEHCTDVTDSFEAITLRDNIWTHFLTNYDGDNEYLLTSFMDKERIDYSAVALNSLEEAIHQIKNNISLTPLSK